jgi:hypothetical protein
MNKNTLIIIFAFLSLAPLFSKPIINIEPKEFNFGHIKSGKSIHGKFKISNTGNDLLTGKIKPTCGCTIISNNEFSLKKGDIDTINFEISTDTDYSGNFYKTIIINSNDADNPVINISIKVLLDNPEIKQDKDVNDIINYLTSFDSNTLKLSNIVTVFSHKTYQKCIPEIKKTLNYIYKTNPSVIINYYNLDINENKNNLIKIQKEFGPFPEVPVIIYKRRSYSGKKQISELIK